MTLRRVVITGLGALTPLGNTVEDFWTALINGVSGAGPITRFDASKFKTHFACEVKNFDMGQYFDRKEIRKYDLYAQFALVAADQAVVDSGLDLEKVNKERVGVIWASGIGGLETFENEIIEFAKGDGTPRFNPFFIPKMIADIAAGHISIRYGFMGPNFATVSACASAANGMIDAYNYIRLGFADVFVTGGSEASVTIGGVGGFSSMHAISTRNDDPKTASRPFDKDRDGFVLGEGGCGLIFEELEHAKARGAKIYAELIGGGLSGDAYHMTAPHPEGKGAALAMLNALKDAGIPREAIDHINTHGTSTPVGDIVEPKAIVDVFGQHAYNISINSTKSMTGHLLGAAGAVEAIVCALAIRDGIIPPTVGLEQADPDCDLDYTPGKAVKANVRVALSNSLGFGGHNGTLCFRKLEV